MKRSHVIFVLVLFALMLAACAPTATPLPAAATQQPTELAVETPTVTLPPPPIASPVPEKALLVAPPGNESPELDALVTRLSAEAAFALERVPAVQPEDLGEEVRLVVLLSTPENLAALLTARPQAQFVVVSPVDLPASANLSVIRTQPELRAMLGGYLSVLLSTDWRAAGLLPADGPQADAVKDAFVNGGSYFCGMCAPGWPLGVTYPQVAQLSATDDGAAYQQAAASLLETQVVEVFYLAANAARPEVYQALQGKEQYGRPVLVIGEQAPPEYMLPQWAATVTFDLASALEELWPALMADQGGGVVNAPLALADVSPDNLGEGRLRLVNELIAGLEAGTVYPFTIP